MRWWSENDDLHDAIYGMPAIACPADGKDCDCDLPRIDCDRGLAMAKKPKASRKGGKGC